MHPRLQRLRTNLRGYLIVIIPRKINGLCPRSNGLIETVAECSQALSGALPFRARDRVKACQTVMIAMARVRKQKVRCSPITATTCQTVAKSGPSGIASRY